jgi:hypothetical protein
MLKRYTKGDKDSVVTRIEQVSGVTLYIPTFERCVDYLYDGLILLCNHYVDEDNNVFLRIPAIDFYNVVLYSNKCCKENGIDTNYISAMLGVVRSFINLKHVNVVFRDDIELRDSYERLININTNIVSKSEIINELTNIYSIDVMEMFLGDMFDQKIIDLINKSFISNGIISNSYLERDFLIEFEFDEYISYINMFVDNNIDRLSMLDEDIMDYLRVFPYIIGDVSKPVIKLYTNYKEI